VRLVRFPFYLFGGFFLPEGFPQGIKFPVLTEMDKK
jgi:hypothetical protein